VATTLADISPAAVSTLAVFAKAMEDKNDPLRYMTVRLALIDHLDSDGQQCEHCDIARPVAAQFYFVPLGEDTWTMDSACADHTIGRLILLASADHTVTIEVASA
jgi:hypothetical protein